MANQTVHFDYDPDRNILFSVDDYDIRETTDVDAFVRLYHEKCQEIGKKLYLVAKIDGLLVRKSINSYYGERAREVIGQHCLGLVRYADTDIKRMSIRATVRRASIETDVYVGRDEALKAIEQMQAATKNKGTS